MAANQKIIAVIGATGSQGGGLVRAILDDKAGGFAVRAITRNAGSDKAKALAAAGAEVVEAQLDDQKSLESAFEGAHGAFAVTNFWEHFSVDKEIQHARNIAAAAKAAGLKHLVWSTLEDTRRLLPISDQRLPTLQEKYNVPHFDGKGEADQLFRDAGVPTTFLLTSFYWDNLIGFGMGPKPAGDGKYAFTLPMADKPLPGIAAVDIGRSAYGVFKKGEPLIGKYVGIAGEHLTGTEMALELSKALGKDVVYNEVSAEAYRGFGFPGAEDLGNMFAYKVLFNKEFTGARPVEATRELNPSLLSFKAWLEKNADKIPLE